MFDLSGRTALVTGAGRGVGVGIAEVLIEGGATVLINDVLADRAEAVVAQLGPRANSLVFDVADADAAHAAVSSVGPIDILVNNAGIPPSMRAVQFRHLKRTEWAPYIDVNLYGVLNCVSATLDGMFERKWGRIVTISSGSGQVGQAIGVSLYAAGKGAGISFMRHLAVECAADGVTANTIALGLMERPGEGAEAGDAGLSVTARMARAVPAGRLGTGRDAGYLCAYLASAEAAWLTGQTIGLNGGALTS